MPTFQSDALVFFGATGDLAYKQIFPSLQGLIRDEGLSVPIIGVAKSGWSIDQLRARAKDRNLIDHAAELVGANRSQFMLASALNAAKNVLIDQSTILADAKAFQQVMDWLDRPATSAEAAGMARLRDAQAPWRRG